MAISGLQQLDFELPGLALGAGLPPIPATWGKRNLILGYGAPSLLASKMWCGKAQASSGEEGMDTEGLQQFFEDPTQWWDNRRTKETPLEPEFEYRKSKDAVGFNNWFRPAGLDSQLDMWDVGMRRPPGGLSTRVQGRSSRVGSYEADLEFGTCSSLCEDRQVTAAVDALDLLVQRGCHISDSVFYFVLKRCIAQKDMVLGKRIHALTVESGYEGNEFLATHLIGMYASYGKLEEAMRVFSTVSPPSAHNWASIIFAYARHREPKQAVGLYRQMLESTVKPDNRIFVAVLKACASAGDLAAGKEVHDHILASATEPDIYVQTCLVDMYAKCGSLKDAERVFAKLSKKNVVTWNAMIAGYVQQGMGQKALALYTRMEQEGLTHPTSVTFVCVLQACASAGVAALHQGRRVHAQIEELRVQGNVVVGASLVNMYAKCGSLEDAHRVFDTLSQKNVVTWTAMIAGYALQGKCQEALRLYFQMQQENTGPPDSVTFVCLLQACASVAALPLGQQLHGQIEAQGLQADGIVGNSLINMYAKCGSLEDAQRVFDSLPEKEIEAWGALVAGYARQGDSDSVFHLVKRMRLEGISPDGLTFLSLLTVCSHVGLVEEGRKYFEAMSTDYGITPTIEHCTCMMDLLGRAGYLDEALGIVESMPFQPNRAVWITLLGACQKWSNVEIGRQAFEFAVRLDDKDASPYVLMSNIYGSAQMWEEAREMQARRLRSGAWKQRAQSSWTDMDGIVHSFAVENKKQVHTRGYPRNEELPHFDSLLPEKATGFSGEIAHVLK